MNSKRARQLRKKAYEDAPTKRNELVIKKTEKGKGIIMYIVDCPITIYRKYKRQYKKSGYKGVGL